MTINARQLMSLLGRKDVAIDKPIWVGSMHPGFYEAERAFVSPDGSVHLCDSTEEGEDDEGAIGGTEAPPAPATDWSADRRFVFAVFFALRDMKPAERAEVVKWAMHEAEHPSVGHECDLCVSMRCDGEPRDDQFPAWWPPLGKYNKFPYAALMADCERWAREEP